MTVSIEPTAGGSKIDDIQTLRGVSIILVLLAHLPFLYPWADATFRVVSPFGFGCGVDLFFVISGFVIARSLRAELARSAPGEACTVVKRFWVRRVFRAATAAVIATLAAVAAFGDLAPLSGNGARAAYGPAAAAAVLNYMNIWGYLRIMAKEPITLLAHYWSLSLEEQFYVVLPILLLAVRRSRHLLVVSFAVIALFAYLDRGQFRGLAWWVRIDGLFWGVALCLLAERIRGPARSFALPSRIALFVVPIAAVVLLPAVLEPLHLASPLTLLCCVLAVYAASQNCDMFQGFGWVSRFLNLMGERSYTIYLWHLLAFTLVQLGWRTVAGEAGSDPTILHGGIITVAAALSLFWTDPMYRWVELPTRALGRRVARRIG